MEKFEVGFLYKNWNDVQSWEFYKVAICQVRYEYFIFLMGLLEPTND